MMLKILEKFLRFLEKRPITIKFSKFGLENFRRLTDRRVVCKFREMKCSRWKIGEVVRCLPDKNKNNKSCLALQLSLLADRAESLPGPAPTMYSECSRFHPNRFAFGGVIA